jgi:hypothetical protein
MQALHAACSTGTAAADSSCSTQPHNATTLASSTTTVAVRPQRQDLCQMVRTGHAAWYGAGSRVGVMRADHAVACPINGSTSQNSHAARPGAVTLPQSSNIAALPHSSAICRISRRSRQAGTTCHIQRYFFKQIRARTQLVHCSLLLSQHHYTLQVTAHCCSSSTKLPLPGLMAANTRKPMNASSPYSVLARLVPVSKSNCARGPLPVTASPIRLAAKPS